MSETLPVLPYHPLADGYAIEHGTDFRTKQVQGGPSRRRRFAIGNPDIVSVVYRFEPSQYAWFIRQFVEERLSGGVLPFVTELIVRDGCAETYEVAMIEDTLSSPAASAIYVDVAMQLEVRRRAPEDLDTYVCIELIQERIGFDESVRGFINRIDRIVNKTIPAVTQDVLA